MAEPVRKKDQGSAAPPQMIACGNGIAGCGKLCKIIRFDKENQQLHVEGFHPGVRLCLGCANHAAYKWGISFDDVDYLFVALHNARVGKCGVAPTKEEVWAILDRLNVKPVRAMPRVEWHVTKETALPLGDRP